jgi:glucosamine kinase
MPHYLAIDAGGTTTRSLLADDHAILARASTGSIKLQRVGEHEATARLISMLQELSAAASVPLTQVARTCMGLAGLTIPIVRTWATQALSTHVSGELLLLGDEEIALDAAFPSSHGILLIAGTGSHAIARASDGTLHRAGGWGPILGDEGGGHWIGLEAVRCALHAHEAGRHSPSADLLQAIQLHWNLASLPELIELGNRRGDATRPAPDFASLAPVVGRCAIEGNVIAADVLRRAGESLARLVKTVAEGISIVPSAHTDSKIPVAFTGSVLEHIPAVRHAMVATLASILPAALLRDVSVDSLDGALYRARLG